MSAANFNTINAAAVFAVTDKGASCGRLLTTGRRRGWSDVSRLGIWDRSRSYPGLALLEKTIYTSRESLDVQIVRRSGYYSGAALDWDIKAAGYSLADDFRGDRDEMAAAIVEDLLADLAYYSGWNNGLIAIHRPRLIRELSGAIERAANEADALCAWSCDVKLRCVGIASNGEAFYSR